MTGPTDAINADERLVQPEFTGTAAEYFRIWIVNLFFTLATLGIYSAWAKVRKRRYFYGSTRLDGDSFDYFASPKAILNGRIIAVAIFAIYALAGELYPQSRYAFWAAGVLAVPGFALIASLTFKQYDGGISLPESFAWLAWLLPVLPIYIGYAVSYAYVQARSANLLWSKVHGPGLRFACTLSARKLTRLYFGNVIAIACSAGLLIPWAVIRTLRYRLANFSRSEEHTSELQSLAYLV